MAAAAAGQAVGGVASSVIEALAARDAAQKAASPKAAYADPSQQEMEFRQGLKTLFGAASGVVGSGAGQLAMILPEIYRQLGYEPTIVDRTAEAEAAQQGVNEIQERIADLTDLRSKARKGPNTDAKKKKVKKLKKQLNLAKRELAGAQENLTQLQSQPIQITGLTPIAAEDMPRTGIQQMVDLTTQQAIEALQGKVETDPTLMRQFDEEEGKLREKLRRQLGPGYETSSPGIQALSDFSKRKTEGIATYTRDLAGSLSDRALGGESVLSDLLSARLNQQLFPSGQTQAAGLNLASLMESGLGIQQLMLQGREIKYSGTGSSSYAGIGSSVASGGAAVGQLAQGIADWWKNRGTPSQGGSEETWTKEGAPIGATMG